MYNTLTHTHTHTHSISHSLELSNPKYDCQSVDLVGKGAAVGSSPKVKYSEPVGWIKANAGQMGVYRQKTESAIKFCL